MYKDEENNIKDKDIINLINYKNKIIIITSDINEITFTSEGNECNAGILVKNRNSDLIIKINNVYLNSVNQIAIDFRGGKNCDYKNKLVYSGINTIMSEDNIGICISNNQTVEITGREKCILNINGGSEMPAIGNNEWTAGGGHLIFSGYGNIEIIGGAGCKCYENLEHKGKCGSYAIGFCETNINDTSTIKILENVNLKAIGGNGQSISSIALNKCSGCGGAAISIGDNSSFEKIGLGVLELIGGDSGESIGEYACGNCANGGDAIKIKSGLININSPAILKGGKGGSISSKCKNVISKGGKGGDCISISESELDEKLKKVKIKIDNCVQAKGGDGGNSGVYFNNENILGNDGGDGGNFINSNDFKVEVAIGDIYFKGGKGGKGGEGQMRGHNGIIGNKFKGDNIYYTEFIKEENPKLGKYNEEIDDLVDEGSKHSDESVKEEQQKLCKVLELVIDKQFEENYLENHEDSGEEENKLVKLENEILNVEYMEVSNKSNNIMMRIFQHIVNLIKKN
ncbi:hypothetical protein [Clostridium sp. ZBS15]|uniref:hypothetical protein n=1 Tax=Clostridium sp. ZBS15 TaxID=2949969 RepID=UPI0020797311|nr:hypothetical protein [Clostridium sp. ZBS15]